MTDTAQDILCIIRDEPGISFRALASKIGMALSTTYDDVQTMIGLGVLDYDKCPNCGRGLLVIKGDSDGITGR